MTVLFIVQESRRLRLNPQESGEECEERLAQGGEGGRDTKQIPFQSAFPGKRERCLELRDRQQPVPTSYLNCRVFQTIQHTRIINSIRE